MSQEYNYYTDVQNLIREISNFQSSLPKKIPNSIGELIKSTSSQPTHKQRLLF